MTFFPNKNPAYGIGLSNGKRGTVPAPSRTASDMIAASASLRHHMKSLASEGTVHISLRENPEYLKVSRNHIPQIAIYSTISWGGVQ